MVSSAQDRGSAFVGGGEETADEIPMKSAASVRDNSRRQYMRDLRQVINSSDVVLQVCRKVRALCNGAGPHVNTRFCAGCAFRYSTPEIL